MNRYEQRRLKRLQNPEFAAGYWAMEAELQLMHVIEAIRKHQHISQETLAERMGKKRESVSRILSSDESNPTLETLIDLLSALSITADITLRQAKEGESPIQIAVELLP